MLVLDLVHKTGEDEPEAAVTRGAVAQRADGDRQMIRCGVDFESDLAVERGVERAQQCELEIFHALVRELQPGTDSAHDEGADAAEARIRGDGEDDAVGHRHISLMGGRNAHLHSAVVSTSGDFDVRAETTPAGVVVVRVSGDLDLATAPTLEKVFAGRPQGSRVVIDLAECTFLDSSGVRVLASAAGAVAQNGGRLDLVVADPGLVRVLAITSMDTLIDVHPSLEAAL